MIGKRRNFSILPLSDSVFMGYNERVMEKTKNVYIIAGPNGSGKTTFAKTFLPEYAKCARFINADLIAEGLSPFSPQQVAIKAGRLVLEQIKEYSNNGVDFAFETTMSGVTYLKYFEMLKKEKYKIHIYFLWIPSSQLAAARVRDRVAQGGHNVPTADIKRRFERSTEKFLKNYRPVADQWMIFNNEKSNPKLVARKQNAHVDVFDKDLFYKITKKVGVNL